MRNWWSFDPPPAHVGFKASCERCERSALKKAGEGTDSTYSQWSFHWPEERSARKKGMQRWYFWGSFFNSKLDLSTVARVNISPLWGAAQHARGGAHAYLHVTEIWNRHNSHFGDVTPTESTGGKMYTYITLFYKDMFFIRGEKKQHKILFKLELFLEGKLQHLVSTLS